LYGWAFDRFTKMLEYKVDEEGMDVEQVDQRGPCGTEDGSQRVERGL